MRIPEGFTVAITKGGFTGRLVVMVTGPHRQGYGDSEYCRADTRAEAETMAWRMIDGWLDAPADSRRAG